MVEKLALSTAKKIEVHLLFFNLFETHDNVIQTNVNCILICKCHVVIQHATLKGCCINQIGAFPLKCGRFDSIHQEEKSFE